MNVPIKLLCKKCQIKARKANAPYMRDYMRKYRARKAVDKKSIVKPNR